MPSKTKTRNAAIAAKTAALPKLPRELLTAGVAPMTAERINATPLAEGSVLQETSRSPHR